VYNAGTTITETSDKGIIYIKPKDAPPAPLLKNFFFESYEKWSVLFL